MVEQLARPKDKVEVYWFSEQRQGYIGDEGPMSHEDTMRSIELLGQEVIPALHEIKLEPYE